MRESENRPSVDQQTHPALDLMASRPEFFARQGSVDAAWRRRGEKLSGPYYRLRYREGRSARSVYLGRAGPVVDRVRHVLHTLQAPLRERRAMLQLRRRVNDSLRLDRRAVDAQLRRLGLRLKGFEVRGWRTSPLRAPIRPSGTGRGAIASMEIKPFRLPRAGRLRFVPRGRAAKWVRQNRPRIPRLPQNRVRAVVEARDRLVPKPRR